MIPGSPDNQHPVWWPCRRPAGTCRHYTLLLSVNYLSLYPSLYCTNFIPAFTVQTLSRPNLPQVYLLDSLERVHSSPVAEYSALAHSNCVSSRQSSSQAPLEATWGSWGACRRSCSPVPPPCRRGPPAGNPPLSRRSTPSHRPGRSDRPRE